MKTDWNYSDLARPYLKRPPYSTEGIERMLERTGLGSGAVACDVGAGVGHLTIPLAERNFIVHAVEPNDEMRTLGMERTSSLHRVTWHEGTGENTGMADDAFDLVTFGSSFNVTDRARALIETSRILKSRGWFACMWNHRDLDDPLQSDVEEIIKSMIPDYGYGARREDQSEIINASGLFELPHAIEAPVLHSLPASDWIEAWRSHATLERQAGEDFHKVVAAIAERVEAAGKAHLELPYTTRIWVARRRA